MYSRQTFLFFIVLVFFSYSVGSCPPIADSDLDGVIGMGELEILSDHWLETGAAGDFNRDGQVSLPDCNCLSEQWLNPVPSIALFINSALNTELQTEIDRYKADVTRDLGATIFQYTGTWTDIHAIKAILIDRYNNDHLIGAVFIGDFPAAYFEYNNSGQTLTDWYYQDLSDKFVDSDGDGKFEREYYMAETPTTMRDIWTARIKSPSTGTTEIDHLRDYFDRNHAYRTGQISYTQEMLYFSPILINDFSFTEEEYDTIVDQIDTFTGWYDSDAPVHSIYHTNPNTQKNLYLSGLANPYEFLIVNIHGSASAQLIETEFITSTMIRDAEPQACVSALLSCSNGDFTYSNYFGGWYLFSGNAMAVLASTTTSMTTNTNTIYLLEPYVPLGLGVPFGQMHLHDDSFLVTVLLGDPTLTMRPKPAGSQPHLELGAMHLDYGSVPLGSQPQQDIVFTNSGTATLKVNFTSAPISIDDEYPLLDYWDLFYYNHPDMPYKFLDFEIEPGQSKTVPFFFYPRADGPIGDYAMVMRFYTNDPEIPYFRISCEGVAY